MTRGRAPAVNRRKTYLKKSKEKKKANSSKIGECSAKGKRTKRDVGEIRWVTA